MANIDFKRKEGESVSSLVHRFTKKVVRSGVLREARSQRFHSRNINRNKRRLSALHREKKSKELEKERRMGNVRF